MAALTTADDGTVVDPQDREDWREWVSATKARNWLRDDPLLDWLERHGEGAGFERDDQAADYQPRTDFRTFVFELGDAFEAGVIGLLQRDHEVVQIAATWEDSRSLDAARKSVEAMASGVQIITQGVLRDPQHRTYGMADLLVRSDVLARLFPDDVTPEEAAQGAPGLGQERFHYRVVDIKYRKLGLVKDGSMGSSAKSLAYQSQVWVYNTALGRIQGYEPPFGYLLGRSWKQGQERGTGCLERLGKVPMDNTFDKHDGATLRDLTLRAHRWIRDLRREGADWAVLPVPTRSELYPHMRGDQDEPWRGAKTRIAGELEELTLLPGVNPQVRAQAHRQGLMRWTDSRVSAATLGLNGVAGRQCDAVLEANRSLEPVVLPPRLDLDDDAWLRPAPLELFVDFETVNDMADDFSALPRAGGQHLIFQIGCGRLEDGEWILDPERDQWTVDRLDEASEVAIIDAWVARVQELCAERGITPEQARIYHWSPAETSTMTNAYNSARERHPHNGWPLLPWFDLLGEVVKRGPMTVTGAFSFGLKSIAKALHAQGLIETSWGDGPTDGMGAMVAAWRVDEAMSMSGGTLLDDPLMREVADYNRVDCQVMAESPGLASGAGDVYAVSASVCWSPFGLTTGNSRSSHARTSAASVYPFALRMSTMSRAAMTTIGCPSDLNSSYAC